ncbi:methyl-accepting chemotaxis protein [Pseudoduganella albidiflava]|uniref:HAMP domain-containing protein n=1 Tax=Pseudoduganella albidiflava TaxID=321983 RepID=A0A411X6T0_9BURK|nr:methyl-accepting chemotaxis protein [Pseudoduganella albidiflava]QBI04614.1 HAMP domain-containing protein [Pseudoduganella albidiflava]GGY28668.1 methyl-accepting chemotaxis protein [Pseudoduganella albidiflava]
MNLSNLRIGARLALGFAVTIVIMLLMSMIGISRIQEVAGRTEQLVNDRYAKVTLLNNMRSQVNRGAQAVRNAMLTPDAAQTQEFLRQMAEADRVGGEAAAAMAKSELTPDVRAIFDQQNTAYFAYKELLDKAIAQYRGGDREGAVQAMFASVIPAQTVYFRHLDELLKVQRELMTRDAEAATAAARSATTLMVVLVVLATIVSALIGWLITRSVTGPVGEAVQIAETVASGDLTAQIATTRNDEMGRLLAALRDMTTALTGTVRTVRDSTDTINTAAAEIASGNMDLSNRTEQQAASLEETASSMEELTSTVQANAENARQANQLVVSAASHANEGGQVVSQVVETMGSIKESSSKIVDIIGVIDGIAFQTNILALNAAVEAARAGEQGRGFAVVASEVRNLAQRSASAAREIKELINDSVEKVDAGSRLVDQAGSTMDRIVTSVQQVADIMNEIASASQEQSSGIAQVNTTITTMDTATQQNAALVEEAAAAAASMREQAQRLSAAIAVFRIDDRASAPVLAAAAYSPAHAHDAVPPASAVAHPPHPKLAGKAPVQPRAAAGKGAVKTPAKKAPEGDDWEEF